VPTSAADVVEVIFNTLSVANATLTRARCTAALDEQGYSVGGAIGVLVQAIAKVGP
jgi:hypothetical protein